MANDVLGCCPGGLLLVLKMILITHRPMRLVLRANLDDLTAPRCGMYYAVVACWNRGIAIYPLQERFPRQQGAVQIPVRSAQ